MNMMVERKRNLYQKSKRKRGKKKDLVDKPAEEE